MQQRIREGKPYSGVPGSWRCPRIESGISRRIACTGRSCSCDPLPASFGDILGERSAPRESVHGDPVSEEKEDHQRRRNAVKQAVGGLVGRELTVPLHLHGAISRPSSSSPEAKQILHVRSSSESPPVTGSLSCVGPPSVVAITGGWGVLGGGETSSRVASCSAIRVACLAVSDP